MTAEWLHRAGLLQCGGRFPWLIYHFQLAGGVYIHYELTCLQIWAADLS